MAFDKKIFLSNIKFLLDRDSIRATVLEEKAGVSKGYFSRLSKQGNNSVPGIDFIMAASEIFGVSVESLLKIDFSSSTENELYYVKFLEQLIKKTENKEIVWKGSSLKDFINKIENKSDEELIVDKRKGLIPSLSNSLNGISCYKSSFEYTPYSFSEIEGNFFSVNMGSNSTLYMVKVLLCDGNDIQQGIEVFMISNHTKKSNVCCISPAEPQKYDTYLFRLYSTVKSSININVIDEETKLIIDNFMKQ